MVAVAPVSFDKENGERVTSFLDGRIDNWQDQIRFKLLTDVTAEPVTLAALKGHLRVETPDDDGLISGLGIAARKLVEEYTGRRLMPRTERLLLDFFPKCRQIMIPASPISSVTAVTYWDDADNASVFDPANYIVDVQGPIGMIVLKYGAVWPILGSNRRPVNVAGVDFVSGYASAAAVPEPLTLAIKMLTGHLYENREASSPLTLQQIPLGLQYLLKPYRVIEAIL
jgi:uncharacterized phiE125 gp8 family phage protein